MQSSSAPSAAAGNAGAAAGGAGGDKPRPFFAKNSLLVFPSSSSSSSQSSTASPASPSSSSSASLARKDSSAPGKDAADKEKDPFSFETRGGNVGGSGLRMGVKRPYTVYKILVKVGDREGWLYKRYSDFHKLHQKLTKLFPNESLKLPPKRLLGNNFDPEFLEARRLGLHAYVRTILSSYAIATSIPVREFLTEGIDNDSDDDLSESLKQRPVAVGGLHLASGPGDKDAVGKAQDAARDAEEEEDAKLQGMAGRMSIREALGETSSSMQSLPLPPSSSSSSPDLARSGKEKEKKVSLDDFLLLRVIGKGSFGKVLLAEHKRTEKVYAIKVLSKKSVKQRDEVKHIMAERNVLKQNIRHPFLVSLHYAFQSPEKLYFVLDYVNGGELFFHLQREKRFPESRAKFYAAEILSALEYLHGLEIIYRDLKPENVLLDASGHVALTDFGLAKEGIEAGGTTSTFCGTPEYLAPEVLRKQDYGMGVDWWCLGAVLYEMLVGLPPFYSRDCNEMYERILHDKLRFPQHINENARSLISGLLERNPERRLGCGPLGAEEIKRHAFFEGIDWLKLYNKEYNPPYNPNVAGQLDLKHIDPNFLNEPIPSSLLKDLNDGTMGAGMAMTVEVEVDEAFAGFSYSGDEEYLK